MRLTQYRLGCVRVDLPHQLLPPIVRPGDAGGVQHGVTAVQEPRHRVGVADIAGQHGERAELGKPLQQSGIVPTALGKKSHVMPGGQ